MVEDDEEDEDEEGDEGDVCLYDLETKNVLGKRHEQRGRRRGRE